MQDGTGTRDDTRRSLNPKKDILGLVAELFLQLLDRLDHDRVVHVVWVWLRPAEPLCS